MMMRDRRSGCCFLHKFISSWIGVILLSYCLARLEGAEAFSITTTTTTTQTSSIFPQQYQQHYHNCHCHHATTALRSNSNDYDDEIGGEYNEDFISPEKSRMTDFIADFLKKNTEGGEISSDMMSLEDDDDKAKDDKNNNDDDDATTYYTHLIAIPMDNCHQLMLELESVQRAILYHCPVLVHACIQQAITRLPLLYVKASASSTSSSDPMASSKLFSIVKSVIEEHLLQPVAAGAAGVEDGSNSNDNKVEYEESSASDLNDEGTRPFTLRFDSLEIDGARNEVLQAVATKKDSEKLRTIVEDLQARIERETGWPTCLPPDPHQEAQEKANNDDGDRYFRARIPFMRLPDNYWNELLEKPKGMEEEEFVFLPSDEGGNGISPIFWGKWADDDFGTARMREVALFKRSSSSNNRASAFDETAFYLPEKFIALPRGNRAMSKQEVYYQDYQESRILEAEALQTEEGNQEASAPRQEAPIPDDDELLKMTKDRLEALYSMDTDTKVLNDDYAASLEATNNTDEDGPVVDRGIIESPTDPGSIDDWTRERIQKIVASRAKVQSEKDLSTPKEKPPIAENEVFRKYREGTLVPKSDPPPPAPELPPFPSRQHCVGFWKVLQSPTGFDVEEMDTSRTDNLVLRVDGTTAGGPILDPNTRQKAAGGTWRLQGDNLRIRLIIPPGKDRILVMEGTLQEVSTRSDIQLASSTFGIPDLEERKNRAAAEMEDMIYCNGDVWVEDAVTKKNRSNVGNFSLMKLNTPTDPKQFTITIPQPIRNQD